MNAAALRFLVTTAALALSAACDGPVSERNVIVETPPFYQEVLAYRAGSEDAIVATVRDFAKEHGMDYLGGPGHPTLDAGQFNLTAAGPNLNLQVVRVVTTLPNAEVSAIARGVPNATDRALTAEFFERLKRIKNVPGSH